MSRESGPTEGAPAAPQAVPPPPHAPMPEAAMEAFLAAVAWADPTKKVKAHVRTGALDDWLEDLENPRPIHVLALGKAAPRMMWGLVEAGIRFTGLGVAVPGVPLPSHDGFHWVTGGHPLVDEKSVAAGDAVCKWIGGLPEDAPMLVCLSGGTSAALEVLDGVSLADAQAKWRAWMAEGVDIVELNKRRATLSGVKAGGLAKLLAVRTKRIRTWAISDVPPDHLDALGGGVMAGADITVLADNQGALQAAGEYLAGVGWAVYGFPRRLARGAEAEADAFVETLATLPPRAVLLAGGEADVAAPVGAPKGGRCHHAAVAAGKHLAKHGLVHAGAFIGASDGIDGSVGTGAWSDAGFASVADEALRAFDAHRWLEQAGRTFTLNATGTNVNDLWLGWKLQ